jgi:hypothetical protein
MSASRALLLIAESIANGMGATYKQTLRDRPADPGLILRHAGRRAAERGAARARQATGRPLLAPASGRRPVARGFRSGPLAA